MFKILAVVIAFFVLVMGPMVSEILRGVALLQGALN